MKTWMLVAAVALAPIGASAQRGGLIAANEDARGQMLQNIEASRAALLPQTEPLPQLTLRYQPRLDHIKASIVAAQTPAELIQGQKDLADWKTVVLAEISSGAPAVGAGTSFVAEPNPEFLPAAFQRQDLAAQRFGADASAWNSGASWGKLFENQSRLVAVEPVRAPAPLAANDPARYAKIRALLLSRGVSSKIVDTAIAEGIRQKVDPMIVLSVISQESNFRKNARNSGSGATGLMQLMPETAADMGVRGSLYDPAANIKAGVKYLNWIANSFFKMNLDMSDLSKVPAEKLKMVLASYNWGVGNVRKSVSKYGAAALDRVAPRETRNYIAEIPSRIYNWFASF